MEDISQYTDEKNVRLTKVSSTRVVGITKDAVEFLTSDGDRQIVSFSECSKNFYEAVMEIRKQQPDSGATIPKIVGLRDSLGKPPYIQLFIRKAEHLRINFEYPLWFRSVGKSKFREMCKRINDVDWTTFDLT